MAEKFDPYRKWLGIPPEEQPPHHYRLLGIAPFEDDTDVITHAADRQMSHVRKFQAGQNGQFSQQILNELAKARLCLLDRAQKIAYDQQLHKTLGGERKLNGVPVAAPRKASKGAPVAAPPQPAGPPPVSATATIDAPPMSVMAAPVAIPVTEESPRITAVEPRPVRGSAPRLRRKTSQMPIVLGIGAVVAFVALIAILAAVSGDIAEPDVAQQPHMTPAATTSNTPKKPPKVNRPKPGSNSILPPHETGPTEFDVPPPLELPKEPEDDEPNGETGDETDDPVMDPAEPDDEPPATEEPATTDAGDAPAGENPPAATEEGDDEDDEEVLVDDPQRAAKFTTAVDAANEAFARRDLKEAARQLAAARQVKQGRDEERQVVFLAELQQHLGTFWRLAATGVRKLKAGDEISFAGDAAAFDHAEDGDVTLMVNDERKSRPLEDVETHYLIALAERGAAKPDNKSRLAVATFLALDASATDADREMARKMLDEVLAEGGRSPALEAMFAEEPQR